MHADRVIPYLHRLVYTSKFLPGVIEFEMTGYQKLPPPSEQTLLASDSPDR